MIIEPVTRLEAGPRPHCSSIGGQVFPGDPAIMHAIGETSRPAFELALEVKSHRRQVSDRLACSYGIRKFFVTSIGRHKSVPTSDINELQRHCTGAGISRRKIA